MHSILRTAISQTQICIHFLVYQREILLQQVSTLIRLLKKPRKQIKQEPHTNVVAEATVQSPDEVCRSHTVQSPDEVCRSHTVLNVAEATQAHAKNSCNFIAKFNARAKPAKYAGNVRLLNSFTILLSHNWHTTASNTKLPKYRVVKVEKNVYRNLRSSSPFCPYLYKQVKIAQLQAVPRALAKALVSRRT